MTWVALAAVLTFLVVAAYGWRNPPPESSAAVPREELERLAAAVEELSRRLQAVERRIPPG